MATKSQAYDHPAYLTVQPIGFAHSSASPARFVAATDLILKNMNVSLFTAIATNNSTHVLWRAAGTSTTTLSVLTIGTGTGASQSYQGTYGLATNTLVSVTGFSLGTSTMSAGQVIGATMSGADGVVVNFGIEAYVVPGSNLTV